ncbi:uncharacterized protein LOC128675293 [Plodia interpunctella]|uniref:uncharacterized protein LOC128675293 n=1 Tax=Plodia interpunctella TaxID=58824 RepID=UPI00236755BD|nr:uncharacterized protein LOC128675293 [Plodia interpunctella]
MTSGAYCAVQGCKNQKTMKEISFFKLPTDAKRREDWLYMIGRPDLLQKPDLKPECHFVCHIHFEEFMMIRKPLLRPTAIPTKNIPTLPIINEAVKTPTTKEDKSTQTRKKFYKDLVNCKSTGVLTNGEVRIELEGEFGPKKAKKRKLKSQLSESEKKMKKLEAEVVELKKQLAAAKVATPSRASIDAKLARNDTKTADSVSITPFPTSVVCETDTKKENIVIKVEIKQEMLDD